MIINRTTGDVFKLPTLVKESLLKVLRESEGLVEGMMRVQANDELGFRYCVMGALCEAYRINHGDKSVWEFGYVHDGEVHYRFHIRLEQDKNYIFAPNEVLNWAGLTAKDEDDDTFGYELDFSDTIFNGQQVEPETYETFAGFMMHLNDEHTDRDTIITYIETYC